MRGGFFVKSIKKLLSVFLVLTLFIPSLSFAGSLNDTVYYSNSEDAEKIAEDEKTENINDENSDKNLETEEESLKLNNSSELKEELGEKKFKGKITDENDNKKVRVIVEVDGDPLIVYATIRGKKLEDLKESEKSSLEKNIISSQNDVIESIKDENINFSTKDPATKKEMPKFTTAFNGFSGFVEKGKIEKLKEIPGVKNVYISQEYDRPKPDMNNSGGMVKAGETWDLGYKGEGTVVAIIDTGIDPAHKDMVLSDETKPKLTKEAVNSSISENNLKGKYFTEKVPYGYNYYDQNDQILDLGPSASEHGMHVAGTVGANGDPENGGVKGIAPESQLLAMKVFSNDPIYATTYDDIYLKAIDEAIKLKADVLNMSLGSTASFYIPKSAVDAAITNAVDNGIVCSISAGNSGYISYGYGNPIKSNPDIGVVGAPGLSKDSISVASVENLKLTVPYLVYGEDNKVGMMVAGSIDPADVFGNGEETSDSVLPSNSVIIGNKAYDIDYLNQNVDSQRKLIEKLEDKEPVYIKNDSKTLLDFYGKKINSYSDLPHDLEYYNNKGEKTIYSDVMEMKARVEYVDCGTGQAQEFEGKDLAGKVALVMRGGNTFVEKITNAQNAGAAGIIVYNHEAGGEDLINMATPSNQTIPAAFIGYKEGKALADLAEKRIQFTKEVMSIPNIVGGQMSDFTSWGTTPTLEIKPEITAPGGQIYSTLQDNKYGTMSGTSMAAPHVSGGSALVRQYISENYEGLSLGEQTRLAKVLLMNTAEPLIDEYDAVYSPRRQGAGLMNLYGAVSTPVTVTDASTNEAKVELKDFDSENFSMTLRATNLSDDEVTYRVDTSVLTDEILNYQGTEYNLLGTVEMDAVVDAPETVTVPANGSTEFTINVDFSEDQNAYRNMFVEGFVTLTEVTDTHPTLSVPYVGFYGDWTEPSIIDGFEDLGEIPFYGMSGMVDTETYFMVPGKAAISPGTEDGKSDGTDTVTPVLSFLRNAEEVQYNILDKDKNNLRTIELENFARKTYIDGGVNPEYSFSLDRLWDGKVNGKKVEDGLYYYQIKSKLQNTDKWQEKDIPVYVDTVAPEITDASYDSGKIKFKVEDATSGFRGYAVWIDGEQVVKFTKDTEVPEEKDEYEIDITDKVSGKTDPKIQLVVFDYALNSSVKTVSYKEESGHPVIYITGPVLLDAYNTKTVPIEGAVFDVNNPVIKVNGKEVEAVEESNITVLDPEDSSKILKQGDGYTFSTVIEAEDVYNTVQVEVTSAEGQPMSISRNFMVDTENPEISASFKEWNSETKKATLSVNMKDNVPILTLYAGDSMVASIDEVDEIFSNIEPIDVTKDITAYAGDEDSVTLKLVDCAGNEAVLEVPIEKTGDSQGSNHEKADNVIDLINNIPSLESLTLDDKGYVESVREAYDDLSQAEKESVDNADILISAENKISELENGLKEEDILQE